MTSKCRAIRKQTHFAVTTRSKYGSMRALKAQIRLDTPEKKNLFQKSVLQCVIRGGVVILFVVKPTVLHAAVHASDELCSPVKIAAKSYLSPFNTG